MNVRKANVGKSEDSDYVKLRQSRVEREMVLLKLNRMFAGGLGPSIIRVFRQCALSFFPSSIDDH